MEYCLIALSVSLISCSVSNKSIYKVSIPEKLVENQPLDDSEQEKIRLGIQEHDKGNYESAESYYKKVLEKKPNSAITLYEIAFTLNEAGRYSESIEYAKRGQGINSEQRALFYHFQGISLDYLGKKREAVKAFKEGIKIDSGFHFLHYSLAITSLNLEEEKQAIESLENALKVNFEHSSSHYMLGEIFFAKGNKVKALLAYTYFLLYEPDSPRSQVAFEKINWIFNSAEKEGDNRININIFGFSGEFSAVELLLGLNSATRHTVEKKDLSDIEFIVEGYDLVLSTIDETRDEDADSSFMSEYYLPYLLEVQRNEYTETLVYLIFETSILENVSSWINDNWEKCEEFYAWEPFLEESSE